LEKRRESSKKLIAVGTRGVRTYPCAKKAWRNKKVEAKGKITPPHRHKKGLRKKWVSKLASKTNT